MKYFYTLFGIIFSLVFTLFILWIHIKDDKVSMLILNENNNIKSFIEPNYLNDVVEYHSTQIDFAKRKVTTFFIKNTSKIFHISIADSFVWVNFTLLSLCGIVIYFISIKKWNSFRKALFNCFFFYSSFSVLFAFYPPVYTYDEPAQYFFIFLGLYCYLFPRFLLLILCMFMSILVRETSILIWFVLFIYHVRIHGFKMLHALYFAIPVIVYAIYFWYFYNQGNMEGLVSATKSRSHAFIDNFGTTLAAVESVFSFVNTCIFSIIFILILLYRNTVERVNRLWLESYFVLLLLNTFITIYFTLACESRLFYLPIIFFVPYSCLIIDELKIVWTKQVIISCFKHMQFYMLFILNYLLCQLISLKLYSTVTSSANYNYFNEYTFVLLLFIGTHFILRYIKKVASLHL